MRRCLLLGADRQCTRKSQCQVSPCCVEDRLCPGTLDVTVFDTTGKELAKTSLVSVGRASIRVLPAQDIANAGEIVYVPIVLADENGVVESNADRKLKVTVEGGELLGFGSANPRTEERFDAGEYTTYYGRSLAVVRASAGKTVKITATDGRRTTTVEIRIR